MPGHEDETPPSGALGNLRRARREPAIAAALAVVLAIGACTASDSLTPLPSGAADGIDLDIGPRHPYLGAGPTGVTVVDGDDWSLPDGVRPAANSGYFSEEASADDLVAVRSIDLSWRQIRPTEARTIDRDASGEAQGMSLDGLDAQLAEPGEFWMRIFASGEDWAPEWVVQKCDVTTYGPDYDDQRHLPIWNECVWGELMDTYRLLFDDLGLAADSRLRFAYVPGAFTWAEFDYDMIAAAVDKGDLDEQTYLEWYDHAWTDLVTLFGEHAGKLVFSGEDYPFGPFGAADDLLAREATEAGMGIRTGITEPSNFHLSEAPAYGSRIEPNGHLTVDESLPIHSGRYIVATENECFTDCGYETDEPYYAVRQANLKALQLRVNWMYLVPGPSYLAEYPEHWDWLRLSLGQTAETSADAWAAFRDAEDTYWGGDEELGRFEDPAEWPSRPYVRNLERWLVQVDEPGSVAHRTEVDVHSGVLEEDNGTAYEGLSTDVAAGDTGFALDVDPRFAATVGSGAADLKVTFLDAGSGAFAVDTPVGRSATVPLDGTGEWRTATIALPAGAVESPSGSDPMRLRVSLTDGSDDLVVRFVRLVRTDAP